MRATAPGRRRRWPRRCERLTAYVLLLAAAAGAPRTALAQPPAAAAQSQVPRGPAEARTDPERDSAWSVLLRPHVRGRWTERAGDPAGAAGLELGAGPASRLRVDVTLNGDFDETESDVQPVFLTRFPPFPPERRRFFAQGSASFAFPLGDDDHLFHSRTLGFDAVGRSVPLRAGATLAGRTGTWDLALLGVRWAAAGEPVDASVVRVRRERSDGNGALGMAFTSGGRSRGASTVAWGADAVVPAPHDGRVSASVAWSPGKPGSSPTDHATTRLRWERRAPVGIGYTAQWRRVGSDFAPPLGVVLRHGITGWNGALAYGRWRGARIERVTLGADGVHRDTRRRWESASAEARWEAGPAEAPQAALSVALRHEDLAADYPLYHGVVFGPGAYRFAEGGLTVATPATRRAGASLRVVAGGFFDGQRVTATLHPTWRPAPSLELAADLEMNRVWVPARGQRFHGDVLRLWLHGAVGPRTSLHAFAQASAAHRARAVNARLQHVIHSGSELWLVFTDGAAADPLNRLRWPWTRRELLLKYSHRVAFP